VDSYQFHEIERLLREQIVLLELILMELRTPKTYPQTSAVKVSP
jgi:hypothetical protein